MDPVEKRTKIIDYLTRHIVGPKDGKNEVITQKPHLYYLSGVLFPLRNDSVFEYSTDDIDGKCEESDIVAAEQVSTLSGKIRPSSMGIEFRAKKKTNLELKITFGIYKPYQDGWKRTPCSFEVNLPNKNPITDFKLDGPEEGILRVIQKVIGGYYRYRVFIVNLKETKRKNVEAGSIIFQPEIIVKPLNGVLASFPEHQLNTLHQEDKILMIQYRKHLRFAATYGCAADWVLDQDDNCIELKSTFIPHYEIKPLTFKTGKNNEILSLSRLSYGLLDEPNTILTELAAFVESYKKWVKELPSHNADLDLASEPVIEIIAKCDEVVERMNKGIQLLNDKNVRESFAYANLAMLMQFAHRNNDVCPNRKYDILSDYKGLSKYKWRPFQLAFFLLSIEPSINGESEYRKVCDLIWFPTGGGKTEAYLGVTAFTIIKERKANGNIAGGTLVLSRYTLRLLTSQQFERTSALICSLEMIRMSDQNKFGKIPISLGLWVGTSSTPNRILEAEEKLNELLEADEPIKSNPFKLANCPCCNSPLLPDRRNGDLNSYGFSIEDKCFVIKCTNTDCIFCSSIPVHIVDEDIYRILPTVVIGTIDKFARLSWVENAGKFLTGDRGRYLSPQLIIQDELHLISGPLGTIAGVYEAAIEALCCQTKSKPHLISSTATVRRADEQCLALYGRHVKQFPPAGLDEADSFFSKKDFSANGRKYLGILAPHESDITVSIRLHALALQASYEIHKESDAYSTLVSYFNSLKELGIANTMAADDIPDRLKVIQQERKNRRPLTHNDFNDLYGEKPIEELDDIMSRLKLTNSESAFLSLALTTNIISVGVDVDRLCLMIVNGQPKTTAEYIQATSRVGRTKELPGLILTKYGAMKPRDRSHYENFRSFHSRIYSHVEPTSVTPFSKPSRDRALHAICVIMMRHFSGGLPCDSDAGRIEEVEELTSTVKEIIAERVRATAADEFHKTKAELEGIFSNWILWARRNPRRLYYEARNLMQFDAILHREIDSDINSIGWNTMDSMRSIDYDTRFQIKGEQYE